MQRREQEEDAPRSCVVEEQSPPWRDRLEARLLTAPPDQPIDVQMSASIERERKKLSLLKKIEQFFSALTKIGRTRRETRENRQRIEELERRLQRIDEQKIDEQKFDARIQEVRGATDQAMHEQAAKLFHLKQENALFSRAYSDLTRRVDAAFYRLLPNAQEHSEGVLRAADPRRRIAEADGLEALLTSFYNTLQERYRGSREEIKRRMTKYLPDVRAITDLTRKPVLDLGAGRGEWLELLAEERIDAIGVDTNPIQIREASTANVTVHQSEACAYLATCADASFGVISAHHLVEHLPFETLVWLSREAMRVLAPGGLLLLETPNPRNILVGATTFYADPTHIQPLPPEVLETLLDTLGYQPVETRFLHPHEKLNVFLHDRRVDPELAHLFFGPQDTAILARKPTLASLPELL